MLDDDFLASASPDSTLQAHPEILITMHHIDRGGLAAAEKSGVDDETVAPLGPAVAIFVATGQRWVEAGRPEVRFGDWRFDLGADEEQLVCLEPIDTWLDADALELRVHDLLTCADAPHAPALGPVTFHGRASRLTVWSKGAVAPDALTDSARALRFGWDGTRAVMHWWHAAPSSVFGEMDVVRKSMARPFMRTAMARGPERLTAAAVAVYRARPTVFEPMKP